MKKYILVSLLAITCLAKAQIPTNGLLREYTFSTNALDGTSNNMHGTVYGATLTNDRCNRANSAYYFSGNNYIELPTTDITNLNEYTYSLWVKPNGTPTTIGGIAISVGAAYDNPMHGVTYKPDNTFFGGSYNVGSDPFNSGIISDPVSPNQWTHIVFTRDYNSVKMYINKNLVVFRGGSNPNTNNYSADYGSPSKALIGARSNLNSDYFFKGSIDDIRIYNRVVNQTEVDALFNESCVTATTPLVDNNHLIVYPNPTFGSIVIENKNNINENLVITITNAIGQCVYNTKICGSIKQLNMDQFGKKGIYFIRIEDLNGQLIQTNKIAYY